MKKLSTLKELYCDDSAYFFAYRINIHLSPNLQYVSYAVASHGGAIVKSSHLPDFYFKNTRNQQSLKVDF